MPIRVFHCDDSQAVTHLVELWLSEHRDIEHVGAAHSAADALARLPAVAPDVVLLDTLGRPDDGSLLAAVRAAAPGAAVVVYSGYVRLMRPADLAGGADAYVEKGDDEGELVAAIRRLAIQR